MKKTIVLIVFLVLIPSGVICKEIVKSVDKTEVVEKVKIVVEKEKKIKKTTANRGAIRRGISNVPNSPEVIARNQKRHRQLTR